MCDNDSTCDFYPDPDCPYNQDPEGTALEGICAYCEFYIRANPRGVKCKSGESCPITKRFEGVKVQYLYFGGIYEGA